MLFRLIHFLIVFLSSSRYLSVSYNSINNCADPSVPLRIFLRVAVKSLLANVVVRL